MLIVTILLSNVRRYRNNSSEYHALVGMMFTTLVSCLLDPLLFSVDGAPGLMARIVALLGNTWMFSANMILSVCWMRFLSRHLNYTPTRRHQYAIWGCAAAVIGILALNLFLPLVFSLDAQNVYHREPLYWLILAVDTGIITDSMLIYRKVRRRGGQLKYFPVGVFLFPIALGMFLQSVFYGVSLIWTSVAISVTGVMFSLQSEQIYRDQLTGLYNRFYLDDLKRDHIRRISGGITGIMLDLNGFKAINDTFGHLEGDQALKTVAELLRESTGDLGTVIRYAGDEFIILLNTQDEAEVEACVRKIRRRFEEFNKNRQHWYGLSVSVGWVKFDLRRQSIDLLVNEMDARMYADKRRWYAEQAAKAGRS